MKRILMALAICCLMVGFVSATDVYRDNNGQIITEAEFDFARYNYFQDPELFHEFEQYSVSRSNGETYWYWLTHDELVTEGEYWGLQMYDPYFDENGFWLE